MDSVRREENFELQVSSFVVVGLAQSVGLEQINLYFLLEWSICQINWAILEQSADLG